ncbi:VOC family protein [Streptomyces sp. NPDC000618]|uniref:VOC family protein n=1 Tax=Streptomyces sp. NPDC000618 TaxID=3154265 RepID=UPI00332A7BD1
MITLTDIVYVRSGAADLEKATRFATEVVGLQQVDTGEPGVAHLRADRRHHSLALVEGPSGVIASAFTVADDEALALAEPELEQRGLRVARGDADAARSRHVTRFIAFDDPCGNRVELVTGQETMAEPVRLTRPSSGISEFGHMCFDAPDVREAHRFWSTTFNARVSCWIGDNACLMRNWNFLRDNGVDIVMGPGKHPTSGSVFLYFRGPEGITYEYATGGLPVDEATWVVRTFDSARSASLDMWQGPVSRPSTQPQLR